MENNHFLIDLFIIYCTFLVVYGLKLKIWKYSKTTEYVIMYSALMAIVELFNVSNNFLFGNEFHLLSGGAFLFFLFIRAVLNTQELKDRTK